MSDDPFGDLVAQSRAAQQPAAPAPPPVAKQSDDPFGDSLAQARQQVTEHGQNGPAPSWSEIPGQMYENAGTSAGNYLRNITKLPEALRNMGQTQRTGMEQRLQGEAPEGGYADAQLAHAIGKEVLDSYGSVDNFKRKLANDPVGVAGDLSMAFTGLGSVGALGRVAQVSGKIGTALDPLTIPAAAVKGIGTGVGKSAAALAGLETGQGMRPFEEAAKAGYEGGEANRAFKESMRGHTTPDEIVDNARWGIENIVQDKNLDYAGRKALWSQSQAPMSWVDIDQALNAGIKEFHGRDLLSPRGKNMRNQLDDVINDWKSFPPRTYHTAAGFDAMKQEIGELRDQFANDVLSPEYKVANNYYKAISDTLKNNVPEYAEAMNSYRDFQDQLKELRKTLSLPADQRKGTVDTALRKLTSTQRRNVNTNFGQRSRLVDELEAAGATNLKAQLAGQALQSWEPHGLARLAAPFTAGAGHIPAAIGMGTVGTPRVLGEAARAIGSIPRITGAKYLPNQTLEAAQQVGRWMPQRSRGGKVDRALRAVKKGHK